MTLKTLSIIGLGYIGLPTAALLAAGGHRVIGVDVSPHVVDTINLGGCHIVEPEIEALIRDAVAAGRLRAAIRPEPADVFLIAVPTPLADGHRPDLRHVEAAARSIAPMLKPGNLVILESTSPVGTTERLARWLAEERPDLKFPQQDETPVDVHVAYCPERVLPGRIIQELRSNDRVVGGLSPECGEAAAAFYDLFVAGECIRTTARTAEMCKLAENSFRDVNIAFANELSMICDDQGIDVWELIRLANRHPRVDILQPGCGVGGHCIAVDPWFMVDRSPEQARLIRIAREVNDSKPEWVLGKVKRALAVLSQNGVSEEEARIACFGISFKPDIDDLRESPALRIAQALSRSYPGQIGVVEPHVQMLPDCLAEHHARMMDMETAVGWAHVLIFLVGHAAFKDVSLDSGLLQIVIDTCSTWRRRDGWDDAKILDISEGCAVSHSER